MNKLKRYIIFFHLINFNQKFLQQYWLTGLVVFNLWFVKSLHVTEYFKKAVYL